MRSCGKQRCGTEPDWLESEVVFPEMRPPQRAWLEEHLLRRKRLLGPELIRRLPDGRWRSAGSARPRLNERYQLHWEW